MSRSLTKREQTLAVIVGAIVLIGGTLVVGQNYITKRATLLDKIAKDKRQLRSLAEMMGQRDYWEQRDQWIQARQPRLDNPDTAGVQLLDQVHVLAKKYGVLLENQTIRTPEHRPACISVALDVETKSPWAPLVSFLEELQGPEQFIALENANLKVDGADATQVHGHFKIARWYAPN